MAFTIEARQQVGLNLIYLLMGLILGIVGNLLVSFYMRMIDSNYSQVWVMSFGTSVVVLIIFGAFWLWHARRLIKTPRTVETEKKETHREDIEKKEISEIRKEDIDVLLAEYRACHTNRDHYSNIKWIIGSIFIAASFTLFGLSFLDEVKGGVVEVGLLAFLSLVLMLIWWRYVEYVRPYVDFSIRRLWDIEKELQKNFNAPILHTTIKEKTKCRVVRGKHITYSLLVMLFVAWILRIILLLSTFLKN